MHVTFASTWSVDGLGVSSGRMIHVFVPSLTRMPAGTVNTDGGGAAAWNRWVQNDGFAGSGASRQRSASALIQRLET